MTDSVARFLTRYFPVFMGTIFMAIFSGAMVTVLINATYLRRLEPSLQTEVSGWALLSLTAFLVFGNFMIARGRRWAAGFMVGYFAFCLMLVIPTIQFSPHTLAYALGIASPLLGLLLLNTPRHREMRQKLSEIRAQRAVVVALYEKHSK
jgi:hypothetical protein